MVRIWVGPSAGLVVPHSLAWPLASNETIFIRYDIEAEPAGLIADNKDATERAVRTEIVGGPWPETANPRGVINMTCGELRFALDLAVPIRVIGPTEAQAA
jgi:hypothetical protein